MSNRNWTTLAPKIERLNDRLDVLTLTPRADRTPAEHGQIKALAQQKHALERAVVERRREYLDRLARIGMA